MGHLKQNNHKLTRASYHAASLLTPKLSKAAVTKIIDTDVRNLFSPGKLMAPTIKESIKSEASKMVDDFVTFVHYHMNNRGKEGYSKNTTAYLNRFKETFFFVLHQNSKKQFIYNGILGIWLGIFKELEFDAQSMEDDDFKMNLLEPTIFEILNIRRRGAQ